ncbi:LWR-salt protein [Halolamina sp. CBA1230]|uniref:LWR-salt protein n=1 Tax=Halolamina sp. CBA1230 TaxID=1853690 RepID=UPI0009A20C5C|nr:LWR-salt protein [Halolamina sp. CBA1230]QKY20583.1 LWR-salt protein [Halolamina sp. CBA1230]
MKAAYVFEAAFRLPAEGVALDPNRFETTLRLFAPAPGVEPGPERIDWLFFRDRLWHGEIGDEAPLRDVVSDWLDVEVVSLSFAELRADEAYLDALRAEIERDLSRFNAETVDEVLHQYLGSSVHVVDAEAV